MNNTEDTEKGDNTPARTAELVSGTTKGSKALVKAKPRSKAAVARANRKAKTVKLKNAKTAGPRPGSKGAKVIELLRRTKGVTLAEVMKSTGWQAHTVRGFLATVPKKHRIKIESTKSPSGDRIYRSR